MSFSNFLEDKVLRHVFGGASYTPPATVHLALFTGAPGEAGGGTELSTSGTGYGRQTCAFTVSGTAPTTASNTNAVEWSPATTDWGTVTHVGVMDAATSGNLLAYAPLTASRSILTGDIFRIQAANLSVTLD
jgi:hypothetical protein